MPGKKPQLTPLAARKQLLWLESELNRAQWLHEARDFTHELRRWRQQAGAFGSLGSWAGAVAAMVRAFSRRTHGANQSRISSLFSCALLGTAVWRWLRALWHKS
jgi:hypothetical protein